jgi:hypothetical protein
MSAYDLGLELVAKRLLRDGTVEAAWRALAAPAAHAIAAAPYRVLAAVSNAVHQLAPGHAEDWTREMVRVAPHCSDPETLLKAGQIRAWMAGLAHYRASALEVIDTLPEESALLILGMDGPWTALRSRLGGDPWFAPGRAFEPMRRVGAFRGFGGLFQEPPRVSADAEHIVVESADETWTLTADAYGATFHRGGTAHDPTTSWPPSVRVQGRALLLGSRALSLPDSGEVTSVASTSTTLAVTFSLSHALTLVALTVPR